MATESSTRIALPHGTFYRGEQLNGRPHGQGREEGEWDRLIYEGGWKNGLRDGFGTDYDFLKQVRECNLMDKYEGEWKEGKPHGEGKAYMVDCYSSETRLVYEGKWSGGNFHGEGKMYDRRDRILYEGDFHNDKKYGRGKYYLFGKLRYEGEFSEDLRHGRGTLYCEGNPHPHIWFEGSILGSESELNKLWDEFINVKQELASEKAKNYNLINLSISIAEENVRLRKGTPSL